MAWMGSLLGDFSLAGLILFRDSRLSASRRFDV